MGNRAKFEASAENVVAHGLLGFRDFSNYGIGAANISQIMLEPEVNSRSHTIEHISRDFSLRIVRLIAVVKFSRSYLWN